MSFLMKFSVDSSIIWKPVISMPVIRILRGKRLSVPVDPNEDSKLSVVGWRECLQDYIRL